MSVYNLPRTSGIYLITCTANNKIYIGSTSNLHKRQQDHFADMERGAHSNRHMQSAWDKYGGNTFIFEVLEYVMPWSRIDREQYWLDKLTPYNQQIGFNIAIRARGDKLSAEHRANISHSNMGHIVTAESRKKLSVAHTGKVLTPEHRSNIGKAQIGKIHSAESRAKQAKSKSIVTWLVINPDGSKLEIVNLKQFCRDNGLNPGHMFEVGNGYRNHHKGYKCHKL